MLLGGIQSLFNDPRKASLRKSILEHLARKLPRGGAYLASEQRTAGFATLSGDMLEVHCKLSKGLPLTSISPLPTPKDLRRAGTSSNAVFPAPPGRIRVLKHVMAAGHDTGTTLQCTNVACNQYVSAQIGRYSVTIFWLKRDNGRTTAQGSSRAYLGSFESKMLGSG